MPLLRYFLYVGGSLLALLLFANAEFQMAPLQSVLTSDSERPAIRIHSERKLPERVVFDTRVAPSPQVPETSVATVQQAPDQAASPPVVAEMSAKARVREAFAQLPPEEDASEPKMRQMATVVLPEPKMYPAKQPLVRHKLAAKPRNLHPPMMVAQQPHFGGFFDTLSR
jgi:hypothetical protein